MNQGLPALASLTLLALAAACGGSEPARRSSLNDDDIAAFGAGRYGEGDDRAGASDAPPSAIELAGGERLEELRATIRFDPGEGSAPTCALYALRAGGPTLEEGRATVPCRETSEASEASERPGDIAVAPVEDARVPLLVAALTGAQVEPEALGAVDPSPRTVRVWLTTDRRRIEGMAAPVRWPIPGALAEDDAVGHAPTNLSEVWEAVMYPERYRSSD